MVDRYASAKTSETDAINVVADLAVEATVRALTSKTGATTVLTAAEMVNGIVKQSGSNGALSVATPTAALMIAAMKNAQIGSSFEFILTNTNDNTVTLTAGTGVTLSGVTAVPTNKAQIYRGILTSLTAVTLHGCLYAPS